MYKEINDFLEKEVTTGNYEIEIKLLYNHFTHGNISEFEFIDYIKSKCKNIDIKNNAFIGICIKGTEDYSEPKKSNNKEDMYLYTFCRDYRRRLFQLKYSDVNERRWIYSEIIKELNNKICFITRMKNKGKYYEILLFIDETLLMIKEEFEKYYLMHIGIPGDFQVKKCDDLMLGEIRRLEPIE